MRKPLDKALVAAALLPGVVLLALGLLAAALLHATLEIDERSALWALIEPRLGLLWMLWFFASLALGAAAQAAWRHWAAAPGRLAESLTVLLRSGVDKPLPLTGGQGSQALAGSVNELVAQRVQMRADVQAQVQAASQQVNEERNRLAALMSELTQSVVVCNLEGQVLLFNARARLQFRALAETPALGGADWLSLGRSIYAVFDRKLVEHALETVQLRLQRGVPSPSAPFVTSTRSGQLLRVQLAPVLAQGDSRGDSRGGASVNASSETPIETPAVTPPSAPAPVLSGYVLMLEDITRDYTLDSQRDLRLHRHTESSRASLANLQMAADLLEDPALDEPTRARFQAVVRDETAAMVRRIQELAQDSTQSLKTRWPLDDMLGTDFIAAALRHIESRAHCKADAAELDAALWLRVDSFSLLQALASLAVRLVQDYGVKRLQLRLQLRLPIPVEMPSHVPSQMPSQMPSQTSGARAQLDLLWFGPALSGETAMAWETEPLQHDGETSALSVRDVVERHGGAFWFERERVRQAACFRFLLPLADGPASQPGSVAAQAGSLSARSVAASMSALASAAGSRPEFYDFDLFKSAGEAQHALADRRLDELSFTVFDTETTGLDPRNGDEIIQIGAVRIVAGKLRRQDSFEQLVDPQRSVPAAGVAIHGIEADMLRGQPTIDQVLPAFESFARDSVLVAHNAAFDMRFFQLKEARTGVRFVQPVLDTLLLSVVIHPQQASHRLEAIAERLDVAVTGRHSALGDALVTAEIFVKMIPLLQALGIHTLGQALDAARKTHYARVDY